MSWNASPSSWKRKMPIRTGCAPIAAVRGARGMERSLAEMVRSGDGQALQELPDIGERLARAIASYVHTGRSQLLDRLQGEVSPEKLFAQLPGIGKNLAERITKQLDVSTLEELEQAAHDGRLPRSRALDPSAFATSRSAWPAC